MNSVCRRADRVEIEGRASADPSDREFCARMLPRVSRTFALSIQSLPPELSDAVCVAYLLCRAVDTVEDDRTIPPQSRRALFAAFDAALQAAALGDVGPALEFEERAVAAELGADAERELAVGASAVFRVFAALPAEQRRIIEPRVLEMSSGMRAYSRRADVEGGVKIRDLEDLERYCYYVAGTVGAFLTDLFLLECPVESARRDELVARSTGFGLGLQLVNILKDVAEDAERGDCFLPSRSADDHGVDLAHLFDPRERAAGLALLRSLAARTREHLGAAEEYTLLWPVTPTGREVRMFCAGPLALALGTLHEIELGKGALVEGAAPTVSRTFVAQVFAQIRAAVGAPTQADSNHQLETIFDRARVGIAGRPVRPSAPFDASSSNGSARGDRAARSGERRVEAFEDPQ